MSDGTHARTLALVASGGFAGANARWGVDLALAGVPTGLAGTLAANVVGCVLLGFLVSLDRDRVPRRARLAVGTGFLSSFTTYSTFVVGTATSEPAVAVGYVVATYALGFAGVGVGRLAAGRVGSREVPA
ncbi:fluoride efflux transporter FluC [Haloarchaeobius salinus]|uniref:fluoride efflux transporter FluC n=1 Tax=Haloarchaeobius salinus TaxID=1198298 RepID=UPI00210DCE81|nr:CrcB family protein [Haloarchaeobius salinus]